MLDSVAGIARSGTPVSRRRWPREPASRCRRKLAARVEVASVAASEDPPRSRARRVAGRVEGGTHHEMVPTETVEHDLPVGPAARGVAPRAAGHAAVRTVVVEPLEVGIEAVVDVADPFGAHRGEPAARPRRQRRRVGALLRAGVEGGRQPRERGQSPVDPLAVDGHEELLGDGQLREVRRQRHRAQALGRPGGSRSRRGSRGDRGRTCRHRRERTRWGSTGSATRSWDGSVRALPLGAGGRAAGEDEGQRRADARPPRQAPRGPARQWMERPHQMTQRSHAGERSGITSPPRAAPVTGPAARRSRSGVPASPRTRPWPRACRRSWTRAPASGSRDRCPPGGSRPRAGTT